MIRRHRKPLALVGALALVLSVLSGCNGDGVKTAAPVARLTPIADCVIDSQNDVEIGGADAPAGCKSKNVLMAPSSSNPFSFGDIDVEDGGTLLITGMGMATKTANTAAAITPTVYREREICVAGGTVKFEKGSDGSPVNSRNKIVMKFVGDRGDRPTGDDPCAKQGFQKGIDVIAGGTLLMYGTKGVPSNGGVSWTTLAAPAGSNVAGAKVASAGLQTLHLTADISKGKEGWMSGDWIVVASTSYVPFDSEFVQIESVTSNTNAGCADSIDGCSTVTLKQPLKYYHFGSLDPSPATATCPDPLSQSGGTQPAFLCDGADRNYGVDERAEVGLISRDIEFTSETPAVTTVPPPATSSVHWGGEIMIHAGFKKVVIQGVRLSKFGKDQLGSYPIHFHNVGDVAVAPNPGTANVLIDADSVDHSYNKCVTIHSTSNLTISNLVCARIVGHIFYEELGSANDDNVADDSGIVFRSDLGIGAMSNSFDIYGNAKIGREDLIKDYWWAGDYMTNVECAPNCIDYDGFNIPDTDNWKQVVHGSCTKYNTDRTGGFQGYLPPNPAGTTACPPTDKNYASFTTYIEPASGFWIQNPDTVLTGNAIAGCEGAGKGYWWVPPPNPIKVNGVNKDLKFQPLGEFEDNRASACYSGFYDETEYSASSSGQLTPKQNGNDSSSVIATLDGMTATHNRFRGVWLRPVWFVIKDGHFAANRENVSLVSSGGIDGNAPGIWELLEDSVVVGESRDNVGRWGPCPQENIWGVPNTGYKFGCIDSTPPLAGVIPHSGAEVGEGYSDVVHNFFGYMLYDGPVRVFHDRFVNFNYNTGGPKNDCSQSPPTGCEFSNELDKADKAFLLTAENRQSPTGLGPPMPYEGDAALGWFQSNQSEYPTGTVSKELTWVNTNLRHQIYTHLVNIADFNDGDKNTAIIDEDGTLSGIGVKLAPNSGSSPVHAISLNNLPVNSTSNSVDECLSRGGQNEFYEGRDSSLMSPASMGSLEFSDLYPFVTDAGHNVFPGIFNTHFQYMTFTRDDEEPDGKGGMYHPSMTLKSRDGQGIWEPKVSSGYGYTVRVAPIPKGTPTVPDNRNPVDAGIGSWTDVGVADVVDANISKAHPFFIRLGVNYTDTNNNHPPDASYFTILRGYKSYTGGDVWSGDKQLQNYWTDLPCKGLDSVNTLPPSPNLPVEYGGKGTCPAAPTTALSPATSIGALTNGDGTPNLKKYYYNSATGYLYLNIAQDEPNPVGPSPIGSCDNSNPDPSCPDVKDNETYYACPKNGCIIYTIALKNDSNYTYVPAPSTGRPDPADAKAAPANPNKLVLYGTDTVIEQQIKLDKQSIPYHTAVNGPNCTATEPPQP